MRWPIWPRSCEEAVLLLLSRLLAIVRGVACILASVKQHAEVCYCISMPLLAATCLQVVLNSIYACTQTLYDATAAAAAVAAAAVDIT
jgi:hypothetical protein